MSSPLTQLTITVPVYWSRPEGAHQPGDVVFDHPTPLDEPSTLPRLLQSMRQLDLTAVQLAIVCAPVSTILLEQALDQTRKIVLENRLPCDTWLVSSQSFPSAQSGKDPGQGQLLDLLSYGSVRNACLAAGLMTGAEAILMIDDDEYFDDPEFLSTVRFGLQQFSLNGLLAGWYETPEGGWRLPATRQPWKETWPQRQLMNQAFDTLLGKGRRYKVPTLALGGNLTIPAGIARRLPFDTGMTRGEDIDYLLTCRMYGIPALMDRQLAIRHDPPPKTHPYWRQFRQDALRFRRERKKLMESGTTAGLTGVTQTELEPYPGRFLGEELEEMISRTVKGLLAHYKSTGDVQGLHQTVEVGRELESDTAPESKVLSDYARQQDNWLECVARLNRSQAEHVTEDAHAGN